MGHRGERLDTNKQVHVQQIELPSASSAHVQATSIQSAGVRLNHGTPKVRKTSWKVETFFIFFLVFLRGVFMRVHGEKVFLLVYPG